MKRRLILALLGTMLCAGAAAQQSTMVVSSEKIFKALPQYNNALEELEKYTADFQKKIDDAYAAVERMFAEYQTQKAYMTDADRRQREDAIIYREKEIAKAQKDFFEGDLMQKRMDRLKPIQDKVFTTINSYAEANGFTFVIDQATNASLLYFAPATDKTNEIIKQLK